MSEVKRFYFNVFSKEVCEDNEPDIGSEDSRRFVMAEDYAALKAERDALAALAEERRQFIVNGVEMGDILLPVIDGDPAIGIHERCLLKPKFAYDAYLNSVRAEGLKMAINHMNNQTSYDCADVTVLPVIEMYNQLRAGKDGE